MLKKVLCLILALVMMACSFIGCGETNETEGDPLPNTKVSELMSKISKDDKDYYFQLAKFATDDIISNWWDWENNHMIPTWGGRPAEEDTEGRGVYGSFWETGQALYTIYDMYVLTGSSYYKDMLEGQAAFIRNSLPFEVLTTPTAEENWATDDCFWNCMLYLICYNVTGDKWFIDVTSTLLDNCVEHWGDDTCGGGMYYNDDRNRKSLYEVGATMSWFSLWKITGEQKYYDKAWDSYSWMHNWLGKNRTDGLYFCEGNSYGPIGGESDIKEGGSASFLTANMGMAALAVMFYNETKDEELLQRAYNVCDGILLRYDDDGVLLDDRDAWTNGAFASYFASYVLTLPNTEKINELCANTATSVVVNDRTPDGYYGGTWKGPSEGSLSIWYCGGSVAKQVNTTGTAVSLVTSMAIKEAGITNYLR